jgi:hypothetical protein
VGVLLGLPGRATRRQGAKGYVGKDGVGKELVLGSLEGKAHTPGPHELPVKQRPARVWLEDAREHPGGRGLSRAGSPQHEGQPARRRKRDLIEGAHVTIPHRHLRERNLMSLDGGAWFAHGLPPHADGLRSQERREPLGVGLLTKRVAPSGRL